MEDGGCILMTNGDVCVLKLCMDYYDSCIINDYYFEGKFGNCNLQEFTLYFKQQENIAYI